MAKKGKLPSFQFYPGDWMKDPALRACSLASRGLWIDTLCLMFESDRRGHLVHKNGQPVSPEQLARMAGCSCEQAADCLQELESCGVFSRSKIGAIYSRRMERDERIRKVRRNCGKLGGNPALLSSENGDLPNDLDNQNGKTASNFATDLDNQKLTTGDNQNPTPSSSSSSSDKEKERERDKAHDARRAEMIEKITKAYPWKSHRDEGIRAVIRTVAKLEDTGKWVDEMAILTYLLERVTTYGEAVKQWPKTEHHFAGLLSSWMDAGRYSDDPETWKAKGNGREKEKGSKSYRNNSGAYEGLQAAIPE